MGKAGTKLKRAICPWCDYDVAVHRNGKLVRHNDGTGAVCDGVGELDPRVELESPEWFEPINHAAEPTDNSTASIIGGYYSVMTEEEKEAARQRRRTNLLEHPLSQWWMALAEEDLEALIPKAGEYSAYDLILMGRGLGDMTANPLTQPDWRAEDNGDAAAAEIACWSYILGKVGRAIGAIKEGRLPSLDTVADVRIYATMIHRIRETRAWPGVEQ